MDRPLKEIKFSDGKVVKIATFFTHGEEKQIETAKWGSAQAEQKDTGEVVLINIPVNQQSLFEDNLVLCGLKEVNNGEKVITDINQELLDSFPKEDFRLLVNELLGIYLGKKKDDLKKSEKD